MVNESDSSKKESGGEPMPDDVLERGNAVLNLELSGFYRHFIERFLSSGR